MNSATAPSSRPTIRVTARHGNAMLSRITAVLGHHELDQFSYTAEADGTVHAVLRLPTSSDAADRVAAKLRRIIGVIEVLSTDDPIGAGAPHGH